MRRFLAHEMECLGDTPTSASKLIQKVSAVIDSSTATRVRVEELNHETGEYRVVLQGSLDMESTNW